MRQSLNPSSLRVLCDLGGLSSDLRSATYDLRLASRLALSSANLYNIRVMAQITAMPVLYQRGGVVSRGFKDRSWRNSDFACYRADNRPGDAGQRIQHGWHLWRRGLVGLPHTPWLRETPVPVYYRAGGGLLHCGPRYQLYSSSVAHNKRVFGLIRSRRSVRQIVSLGESDRTPMARDLADAGQGPF